MKTAMQKVTVVFALTVGVVCLATAIRTPACKLGPDIEIPAKPSPAASATLPMVTAPVFDASKVRPMARKPTSDDRGCGMDVFSQELEQGGRPGHRRVWVSVCRKD